MSWWQKKLLRYGLRYGLAQTGLLDDSAIDLDNLDITIGRQNVIELKDVGLNIARISQLAQLPPALRLETARVLLLKLTIPADVFQSSIIVEVNGVEVVAVLQDDVSDHTSQQKPSGARARSPESVRTPQHRKTNRRIHSPPPYDPGGPDQDARLPNVQDIARSFLLEEPLEERQDLEAMAYGSGGVEESFTSESSSGEAGIGTGVGVPGFLTTFLQGIVERFQLVVKDLQVRIDAEVQSDSLQSMPVTLRLRVGTSTVAKVDQSAPDKKREISLSAISVDLLSQDDVLAELASMPSCASAADRRSSTHSAKSATSFPSAGDLAASTENPRLHGVGLTSPAQNRRKSYESERSVHDMMQSATGPTLRSESPLSPFMSSRGASASVTVEDDLAYRDDVYGSSPKAHELDIQPGDDNISWGSRRSKASAPTNDLWGSMMSEDDLPDSLLIAQPALSASPHAQSSRGHSPFTARQRRAVSPYDRGIPSPRSWPGPEDSPHVQLRQGPGSWPTLDREPSNTAEPLDQVLTMAPDESTDNKLLAMEQVRPESPMLEPETPLEMQDSVDESMMESRFFSHEDAQSMYMSAMTGAPASATTNIPGSSAVNTPGSPAVNTPGSPAMSMPGSPTMNIPGGWGYDTQNVESTPSDVMANLPEVQGGHTAQVDGALQSKEFSSGNATPRAQTPVQPSFGGKTYSPPAMSAVRELLHIDRVTVTIPCAQPTDTTDVSPKPTQTSQNFRSSSRARGMPGTFSAYSELSASRRRGTNSAHTDVSSVVWSPQDVLSRSKPEIMLNVTVSTVLAQVDVSTGQLLFKVAKKLSASLPAQQSSCSKPAISEPVESALPQTSLYLQRIHISLAEQIDAHYNLGDGPCPPRPGLVDFDCENLALELGVSPTIRAGAMQVLLGGQDLLTFDVATSTMSGSIALPEHAPVVAIDITNHRLVASEELITEIDVQTAPIRFTFDVGVFDETFDTFGGLSGILELGNSVFLDSGMSSPTSSRAPKGVRFAGAEEPANSGTEFKVNARISGVTVNLRSVPCSAILRTSTIKAIYREGPEAGSKATISRVVLSGPHYGAHSRETPLMIDLATISAEYLPAPCEKDLERLISLLMPSRDQYDDRGDILIDTLVRQRRNGALLRAAVGDVKVRLDNFECLTALGSLANDLAKLSAVSKYLPENDKPGLLTLLRIRDAEARMPVNDRFGTLICALQDLHLAHVGLPALLAFSIGDILAQQDGGPELIRTLLPLAGVDKLPVVMARTIGNEIDPTVKVKVFNVCLEYSVPVVLALTNLDRPIAPEELVTGIAQSIANLTMLEKSAILTRSPASDASSTPAKKTNISLLIHDSAIGLTPQKLHSKVLVVLNDAHVTTSVPPGETMSAKLELRKAAIFITDHVQDESSMGPTPSHVNTMLRLSHALTERGFVSVGSIMSAVVDFRAKAASDESATKVIEVDVKNELFLLETCADSTQTLFATLGALAPPTPPSNVPKYLTQPMPIEDMMASFSGEPILQPEEKTETLFDVEHDPDDIDDGGLLGVSTFDDPDELLAESEMNSSLYGPVSGLLGMEMDADEEGNSVGDYPETAESLLEEDPFEMTLSPEDAYLGDAALLRDLNRQSKPAVRSTPVDLGLYEIEDLGYDALGSGQQALGGQHRFNAPFLGKRGRGINQVAQDIPFRLRLRDMNLIWHLYDGYDWQRTQNGIVDAVEQLEQRAEERKARRQHSRQDPEDDESIIGDFLFNSIYITVPADLDAQDIRRQINRGIDHDISETESVPVSGISRPTTTYSASGLPRHKQSQRRRLKLGRSRSHKIAFELKSVSADVVVFPPSSGEVVSSVDVRLKDFEIFDKVPTSTWRKFLTHLHTDTASREMSKPMFHIQLDNVKTLESHSASEIVLHVTVLPLRLHVDQDALEFITRFFEFNDPELVPQEEPGEKPFLQRIEVDTVDLCLDYKPKTVDYAGLRSGRTKEFMNFVTLEGCNIRLKHAIIYGLQGFDLLHDTLSDVWTPDVIRNQLPRVLSGLAPVRSLVNLGIGVRDVVAIPIREYQKDGRIVRSIQKGAFQFGKTTAGELVRLGAKVALGTQTMLSNAEDFLAPGNTSAAGRTRLSSSPGRQEGGHVSDEDDPERQRAVSAYANQPLGVLSGLRSARRHLEHDLLTARDALIAVQGEVLESRGPVDVAGAVVKHAPTVILRPVIGATRAVGTALLGVGNAVDRGNLRRVEDVSFLSFPLVCVSFCRNTFTDCPTREQKYKRR